MSHKERNAPRMKKVRRRTGKQNASLGDIREKHKGGERRFPEEAISEKRQADGGQGFGGT